MDRPSLFLMASQKFRPTALRRFFRTSTYCMYAFAPEKPPSLVGRNFCLAIGVVFAKSQSGFLGFLHLLFLFRVVDGVGRKLQARDLLQ